MLMCDWKSISNQLKVIELEILINAYFPFPLHLDRDMVVFLTWEFVHWREREREREQEALGPVHGLNAESDKA